MNSGRRRNNFYKQQILHPEVIGVQMQADYAQDNFVRRNEYSSPFMKAQVISVDLEGGKLENPNGEGECDATNPITKQVYKIKAGISRKKNPARSIRAKLLTGHFDAGMSDSALRIYYPTKSSEDPVPLEYVYVFFEDSNKTHGIWIDCPDTGQGENFAEGDKNAEEASKENPNHRLAKASGINVPPDEKLTVQRNTSGSPPDQSSMAKGK
jgi:hypothetical protein